MDLIADVGATHTRCALIDPGGNVLAAQSYTNAQYSGLDAVLSAYLQDRRKTDKPMRAALAIAAPLDGDEVVMTNLGWSFSGQGLKKALGLYSLDLLNDFEALACGLSDFGDGDRQQIGAGQPVRKATIAVLGPGSGLGVASLVPHPEGWTPVPGEGGHVTLAAYDAEESSVIEIIREQYGHCSAERVLSGPGIVNLHSALVELSGDKPTDMTPQEVTELAQSGDRAARRTMALFFAFLGTVASDLALTVGARGGIYIGGGIVPKYISTLRKSRFRDRFESKGRYRKYLASIPTYVITDPIPAFRGLRRTLGHSD